MALTVPVQNDPIPERKSFLVVDDEVELVHALSDMLTKQGFDVTGVNSGKEALEKLHGGEFDLLLADLMMPEMDGITLMKQALQIDPSLVCLIMTGQGTVQTAVEAMQNGAFDYILKPFKLNTVLTAINRSLEVRRLRLENVHLREIVNIHELGRTVAYMLDIGLIIDKTAAAALHQVQADEVSILIPVQDQSGFVIAHANGNEERASLVGKKVPSAGTIAGWVAEHMQPLSLHGKVEDARFSHTYPREEIYSAVSLPMISGSKLVGVINLGLTHQHRELTQGQIRALSILVGIAASAMENARLYQQTEKRLQRLSALRTIDLAITSSLDLRVTLNILLDQVAAQLEVDAVVILLQDPKSQILEYSASHGLHLENLQHDHLMPGAGISGAASVERRTIRVDNLYAHEVDTRSEPWMLEEGFRSCYATPLIAMGEVEGVLLVLHRSPLDPDPEWVEYFEALAGQAAIAINSARLFDSIQRSNQQLTMAYNTTIEGWSRALDLRDHETEGHTQRVTELTLRLVRALGNFDEEDIVQIRRGALLHDIGKMGVPDHILLKHGELNEEEWAVMRKHPEYAYQLLYPIVYLRKALDIPYYHHEHWDGSGYPHGLKADQIPRAARIFAVADVWDALRSDRPYRPGWDEGQVREYIRERAGTQFDPEVVEVFLRLSQEV